MATAVSRYAYVFSVFKDPQYMLGAIVSAYSIKCTDTKYNLVCMTTPDISNSWTDLAKQIFDDVITVPYIQGYTIDMKTRTQQKMYKGWKNISFTKWNCMKLIQYEKILFIDADKVILENIDHLFDLQTPAGTFSSPFSDKYGKHSGRGIKDYFWKHKHGDTVETRLIQKGLKDGFVVIGTCILLKPCEKTYIEMINTIESYTEDKPFGFPECNSMIDEQFICFQIKNKWTYISQKYNWIPWHSQWLRKDEYPPAVIHYFSTKPWVLRRSEYHDLEIWWDYVTQMIHNIYKDDKEVIKLYREDQYNNLTFEGCSFCKILKKNNWESHSFMVHIK